MQPCPLPLRELVVVTIVAAACAADQIKVVIARSVVTVPTGAVVVVIAHPRVIVRTAPNAAAAKSTGELAGTKVVCNQPLGLSLL
jgi:hypothetical protein